MKLGWMQAEGGTDFGVGKRRQVCTTTPYSPVQFVLIFAVSRTGTAHASQLPSSQPLGLRLLDGGHFFDIVMFADAHRSLSGGLELGTFASSSNHARPTDALPLLLVVSLFSNVGSVLNCLIYDLFWEKEIQDHGQKGGNGKSSFHDKNDGVE